MLAGERGATSIFLSLKGLHNSYAAAVLEAILAAGKSTHSGHLALVNQNYWRIDHNFWEHCVSVQGDSVA